MNTLIFLSLLVFFIFIGLGIIMILHFRKMGRKLEVIRKKICANPPVIQSDHFEMNCRKYFLTSREIQIVLLIRQGIPYKNIADQLCIAEKTVGRHVSNMFTKVKVNNKVELINKLGE